MRKLNNMILYAHMIVCIYIYMHVYIYFAYNIYILHIYTCNKYDNALCRGCDPKPTFTVLNHGNNHRYR